MIRNHELDCALNLYKNKILKKKEKQKHGP